MSDALRRGRHQLDRLRRQRRFAAGGRAARPPCTSHAGGAFWCPARRCGRPHSGRYRRPRSTIVPPGDGLAQRDLVVRTDDQCSRLYPLVMGDPTCGTRMPCRSCLLRCARNEHAGQQRGWSFSGTSAHRYRPVPWSTVDVGELQLARFPLYGRLRGSARPWLVDAARLQSAFLRRHGAAPGRRRSIASGRRTSDRVVARSYCSVAALACT